MQTTTTPAARAALHRLIDLALDAKAAGHDVFVDLAPHVSFPLTVRAHRDGWTRDNSGKPTYDSGMCDLTEASVQTIIADVERVLA